MSDADRLRCSYLGCTNLARAEVLPQYPGLNHPRILRCRKHLAAALDSYARFDNRQTLGTRSVTL